MDKELKIKKMCKTILDSEIGEDIWRKIDCIGVDCAKDNCPFSYLRETCPNRIDAITTFKMKDISKKYLKKEYLGWELLKEVSEGKFKNGTVFQLVDNKIAKYEVNRSTDGYYYLSILGGGSTYSTVLFTNGDKFIEFVEEPVDFIKVLNSGKKVKLAKELRDEIFNNYYEEAYAESDNEELCNALYDVIENTAYCDISDLLLALSWVYTEGSLDEVLKGKNFIIKE